LVLHQNYKTKASLYLQSVLSANKIWCPKFGKYLEGGLKVNLKSSGIVAASLKQF